jgi:hypothetical protein
MPAKKRSDKNDSVIGDMKAEFIRECAELWDEHQEKFLSYLDDSDDRKIKLAFGVTLDFSDDPSSLETVISYAVRQKDKRSADFDGPEQLQVPGTTRTELNGNGENGTKNAHSSKSQR